MQNINNITCPHWQTFIQSESQQPYFQKLQLFLNNEQKSGKTIFPEQKQWFNAFEKTPLKSIKVVIVGQDPYIHPNQAMGLSFSVPKKTKVPPSLKNIYKEIYTTQSLPKDIHGDLTTWTEQGVFLLNASLTVEQGKVGSHLKKGWDIFTKNALNYINHHCENIVFLAWGAFAHKCCQHIDRSKHLVLKTSHPSPLGAYKSSDTIPAFLGSNCFNLANDWLKDKNQPIINWYSARPLS